MQLSLLRLLQLVSPTLPVGAYAYSQGLEYAMQAGWVHDERSSTIWLQGLLKHGMATLDVPVAMRLYTAWNAQNLDAVWYWNDLLFAMREAKQMQQQDMHLAQALVKILQALGVSDVALLAQVKHLSFLSVFMLAASHWRIDQDQALQGMLWAWLENLTLIAVKTVPLGQTAGQRILFASVPIIQQSIATAAHISDPQIGSSLPIQAIAMAKHETLYSRLYRS